MTTHSFQWAIICLFSAVIGLLGIETSLVCNQHVDPERRMASADQSHSRPATDDDARSTTTKGSNSPGKKDKVGPSSEKEDNKKTYQVDVAASRAYVKVGSATRLGHPHGVEGKLKSGKISPLGSGELVFAMSSFQADTKEARKKVDLAGKKVSDNEAKKVQKTMLSADVLDVDKYPTATYKISTIKPVDKQEAGATGAYQLTGKFTLHGTEQALQFKAKLQKGDKEGTFKLTGSFTIKQTAHGITPYSAFGGLAKVADELEVFGELVLVPAPAK